MMARRCRSSIVLQIALCSTIVCFVLLLTSLCWHLALCRMGFVCLIWKRMKWMWFPLIVDCRTKQCSVCLSMRWTTFGWGWIMALTVYIWVRPFLLYMVINRSLGPDILLSFIRVSCIWLPIKAFIQHYHPLNWTKRYRWLLFPEPVDRCGLS